MTTLFIDRWSSECGDCHRGADPMELHHDTVLSYAGQGEGCGARFTEVGSHYVGSNMRELAQNMRGDLPWTERVT